MFAFIDSNSTAEPDGGPHKVLPKTYRLIAHHPRREIEYSSKGTIGSMTSSNMEAFFVELYPMRRVISDRETEKRKEQNR